MSFRSRKNSIGYAISGLRWLFLGEPNTRLHAAASILAVALGVVRHIGQMQWAALVFAIGLVWITEAINTCIEKLCDFSCDNRIHPAIKVIKDVSAGAVLMAAIVSIAIGVIIFIF